MTDDYLTKGNPEKPSNPIIKIILRILFIGLIIFGINRCYIWYSIENTDIEDYRQGELDGCAGIGLTPLAFAESMKPFKDAGISEKDAISFCQCSVNYSIDNDYLTLEIMRDYHKLLNKTLSNSEKAQLEKTGQTNSMIDKVDAANRRLANEYDSALEKGYSAWMYIIR